MLVGVVREIVRDLIAECIATLAVRLPMWLAEVGLTLGIGTPWVAGQVAALVAKWVNRIGGFLEALIKSFRKLAPLLSKLDEIIDALRTALRRADAPGPNGRPRDLPDDSTFFHSDADPLGAHGSGMSTHPAEVQAMIREAEAMGIEIHWRDDGAMAYSPGLSPGQPGTLHLDPDASYGAWLHEMNHARDDAAANWPGMRGWFEDPEVRIANERRAYDAEIAYARSIGDEAAAARLEELFQAERRQILGLDE